MKICFLTTAFPRWLGDSHSPFLLDIVSGLKVFLTEIFVVAMHSPGAKTFEIISNVKIFRPKYLPEKLEIFRKEAGGLPAILRKKPLFVLLLIPYIIVQCAFLIRVKKTYDLIHANWTLSGFIAWVTCLLIKKKYVITVHGSDLNLGARLPVIRNMTKVVLINAEKVICVSKSLADLAIELGIPQEKISIIPNGVNINFFNYENSIREPIILFVGSLTENKGVHHLIHSMPSILEAHPNYKLIIIGDGYFRGYLESEVIKLNLESSVFFLGQQPPNVVRDWMKRSFVFVLPSLKEGLGVVLIEALSCGVPCIGSAIGGIPDVIDETVGRLVKPGSPIPLANEIIMMIENPDLMNNMRLNARRKAEKQFDLATIANQIYSIYKEASKTKCP